MERLTNAREAAAQRRTYEKRLEQGYPRNIPEERFLKLAAYEDTGLDPEELLPATALSKVACALHELNAYKDLGPVDRIRELAQARQFQTNADRIRTMSDEELAKFLYKFFWGRIQTVPNRTGKLLEWLQQPAEEDD